MTPEAIREALESAEGLPADALRAAATQAAAVAPAVIAAMERAAAGVHILPREENLLFLGVHALAAARDTSAYRPFLALLRLPEDRLDDLVGATDPAAMTSLLLGLYDGDADPLFAMIEHPAIEGVVRWVLFQVLARLAWEDRIPRARVVDLLARFDGDDSVPVEDDAWMGWQTAIVLLGLEDFEPRLRAGWAAGRCDLGIKDQHAHVLADLALAAADPANPDRFVEAGVVAFDDPVEGLAWIESRSLAALDTAFAESESDDAEAVAARDGAEDPAAGITLAGSEIDWLESFLASIHVPEEAMNVEMLDGYLCALVAGPVDVPPLEWLKSVWSPEKDKEPEFDSSEQGELVLGLMLRHWRTIAARLEASAAHEPLLAEALPKERGRDWAAGFLHGIYLNEAAWESLVDHKQAGALATAISLLVDDEADPRDRLSVKDRTQLCDHLGETVLSIRSFWHDPDFATQLQTPARSTKIGRNEACPCGSGRKYKKCCGAAGAVH